MKHIFTRKQIAIILIATGVISALVFGLSSANLYAQDGKNGKNDKAPGAAKPALTVNVVSPSNGSLALKLTANGNIAAWQEAIIGAEVNGLKLVDVRVNVGDVVKRGQILATFSVDGLRADLLQARATLAEAQATAAEAAANANRARSLQDTDALSAQQISQFTTAQSTAQSRVDLAKAQLANAQVRLNNAQLTAPDSGIISARTATVGSVVGAGTELFRMVRQGRLEWRAEVTSRELASIKPGQVVSITSATGAVVEGKVRVVAPTVDPQTRNALVYVDVPQNPGIKAGMFAKGEFALGSASALTLPQQALVLRDGFTYAMRLEVTNKVSQIKLQTGRRVGDAVEILQGVKSGEKYVASGAAFLTDGDTVRVVATENMPATSTSNEQPAIK